MKSTGEVTKILQLVTAGDRGSVDRLMTLVYDDFRALAATYMARESTGHTLEPTALVNEAFLKLVDQKRVNWQNRSHFFAVGAQIMRRILVDHARKKKGKKRGGGWTRVPLREELQVTSKNYEDVLALDDALQKLEKVDPDRSKVVELRFFGGLTLDETAEALGVTKRTVQNHWTVCSAWLRRELTA